MLLPWTPPHAFNFRTLWVEEDGPGLYADEVEISRRFCRENDTSRRPEVEDSIGRDAIAWIPLVDDDIQSFVIGPVDSCHTPHYGHLRDYAVELSYRTRDYSWSLFRYSRPRQYQDQIS